MELCDASTWSFLWRCAVQWKTGVCLCPPVLEVCTPQAALSPECPTFVSCEAAPSQSQHSWVSPCHEPVLHGFCLAGGLIQLVDHPGCVVWGLRWSVKFSVCAGLGFFFFPLLPWISFHSPSLPSPIWSDSGIVEISHRAVSAPLTPHPIWFRIFPFVLLGFVCCLLGCFYFSFTK